MARIEFTTEVNRPIEEVFAYLTDPANLPEWQSGVIEGRLEGSGPVGVGSRMVEVRKFLGKRMESTLEVTEYESNRRFAFKVVSGPVPFRVDHTFKPSNGATRIHVAGEGEPGGFFRLAEPLVIKAVERETKKDFETLKDLLEARG
jgi:uncharacterized protein YndB with AHSA1/START domain